MVEVVYQSVSSLAFKPDGKTLISGSDDDMVRLRDVADLVISCYNYVPRQGGP